MNNCFILSNVHCRNLNSRHLDNLYHSLTTKPRLFIYRVKITKKNWGPSWVCQLLIGRIDTLQDIKKLKRLEAIIWSNKVAHLSFPGTSQWDDCSSQILKWLFANRTNDSILLTLLPPLLFIFKKITLGIFAEKNIPGSCDCWCRRQWCHSGH